MHDPAIRFPVPLGVPWARWLAIALAVLVLLVFGSSIGHGFVFWDDYVNIVLNPHLQTSSVQATDPGWIFSFDTNLRFMPVTWLGHLAICGLFGVNPTAYHATLVALHLVNCLLLYQLVLRVLARFSSPSRAHAVVAFFAGAFWGLNPLRVEPVAWCTALHYPLATLFVLVSFHCYLRSVREGRMQLRAWLGCSFLGGLGACTYPITLGYSIALLFLDRVLFPEMAARRWDLRAPGLARYWLSRGVLILPSIAVAVATVCARLHPTGEYGGAMDQPRAGLLLRLLHGVCVWAYIQVRQFWPTGLSPAHYPWPEAPSVWSYLPLVFGLLSLVVWAFLRRAHVVLALLGASAALTLPMLGLTEDPSTPVDRYTYLPNAFLVLLLAWVAARYRPQRIVLSRAFCAGALACLTLLAIQSHRQLSIWANSRTLFTALDRAPEVQAQPRLRVFIYGLQADQLVRDGHPGEALVLYDILVRVAPGDFRHWQHRGIALYFARRYAEAFASLQHAEGLRPDPTTRELLQVIGAKLDSGSR